MKKDIEYLREQSHQIDNLHITGEEKKAIALLKKTTDEAKEINEAYYQFFLGEKAGYKDKNYEMQYKLFKKATQLKENDFFLIRNKGISLSHLNNINEAIKQFDLAIKINPKDYIALNQKGVVLNNSSKYYEAIKQYNLALKINPNDYNSLREKGLTLCMLGNEIEAISFFKKALSIKSDDYRSSFLLGICYSDQGKKEEAVELFRSIQDKLPEAKANIAEYEFKKENYELAIQLISEAFNKEPNNNNVKWMYSYISTYLKKKKISFKQTPQVKEKTKEPIPEIIGLIKNIRETMSHDIDDFLEKMKETEKRRTEFLSTETLLDDERSLFLVLRKWNSYTPIIPDDQGERYIGGGYFIFHEGNGTVIDPGYNFIENFFRAGGRVTDIHNIILTHAHNDHTNDFESILSLIYQFNSKNDFKSSDNSFKKINIYMNIGCFKKFSGLLDLRGSDYIDNVYTLSVDSKFKLGEDLEITTLKAYHDELITKKYAVGIRFDFLTSEKTIILTSDTGLFPNKKNNEGKTVVDHEAEEIWKTYNIDKKDKINLLITHIGSIKESELKEELYTKPEKIFYPNHLGIIGTSSVISAIKPKLAVVSEFGEELKDFQEKLIIIIDKIVQDVILKKITKVAPGDTPLVYDIKNEKFYCILTQEFRPIEEIDFSLLKQKFYYFSSTCTKKETTKAGDKGTDFETALKNREGIYFKKL